MRAKYPKYIHLCVGLCFGESIVSSRPELFVYEWRSAVVCVPGQDEMPAATQQYSAGVSAADKEVSAAQKTESSAGQIAREVLGNRYWSC